MPRQPLIETLRGRLALFLAVAFMPLLWGAFHMASENRNDDIRAELDLMQYQTAELRNVYSGFIEDAKLLLSVISLESSVRMPVQADCNAYLSRVKNEHSGIGNHLRVYSPGGEMVCSSIAVPRASNVAGRPAFKLALTSERPVVGNAVSSQFSSRPVLPVYQAVRDTTGTVTAVVAAIIETQRFVDQFAREKVSPETRLGLFGPDGIVLARYPDPENLTGKDLSKSLLFQSIDRLGERGVAKQVGLDGVDRYVSAVKLVETAEGPIRFFINQPVSEVRGGPDRDFYLALGIAVALVMLIHAAIWFGGERWLVRPLMKLVETAQKIGGGDLTARVNLKGQSDEIRRAMMAINTMADSLSQMESTVRSNRALQVLVAQKRFGLDAPDESAMLAAVCDAVVNVGGYVGAWVSFAEHDEAQTLRPMAAAGLPLELLKKLTMTWREGAGLDTGSARAIREGRIVLTPNLTDKADSPKILDAARQFGIASSLAFPVMVGGRIVGAFTIFGRDVNEFREQETHLLEEVARDVGRALESMRERASRQAAEQALATSRRQLEEAERVARVGSWLQVNGEPIVKLSKELVQMFELDPNAVYYEYDILLKLVHPDDRQRVVHELAGAGWLEMPLTIAHRIMLPSGRVRYVQHHVEITSTLEGTQPSRLGVVQDVTELERAQIALRERIKELRCLYEVFRTTEEVVQNYPDMFERVVALLPQAWMHAEHAAACIRFAGRDYTTPGFRETEWLQAAPFDSGDAEGVVMVCYLNEMPAAIEGPFLAEERELLNAVASRLEQILQRGTMANQMVQRESLHTAMINQARDSIALIEVPSGRFIEFNRAAHENLGYTAEEFAELTVQDIDANHDDGQVRSTFELMAKGDGSTIETRHRKRNGELIDVRVSARAYTGNGHNYHVTFWSDISNIKRNNRQLRAIADATREIVFAKDEQSMLHGVCEALVTAEGYPMAWVGYALEDDPGTVAVQAGAGMSGGYLDSVRVTWRGDDPTAHGPTGTAIREGRPVTARHIHSDPKFAPWRESARKYGFASSVALPLFLDRTGPAGGRAQGAIMFYASVPAAFDDNEVQHLMGLADALSFGIAALRSRLAGEQAEVKVRQVMERLTHLLGASPVVMYSLRPDGENWIPYEVSDNVGLLLGYTREDVLSPDWWISGLHPDDREHATQQVGIALTAGHHVHEYRFRHRVGHYLWIRDEFKIVRDARGLVVEMIGAWTDITVSKRAESEIRKLSAAVEQSPNSVMITDLDANIEYVNDAFVKVSGYSRAEVVGRNPRLLQSGRVPFQAYQNMWRQLLDGKGWRGEFINRRKDGRVFIERATIVPLRGDGGMVTHYVAVAEDVTELKEYEDELRKLSLVVEQSPSSIAITDLRGNIEYVNKAFEHHSGYSKSEVLGKNPRLLQSGKTPPQVYEELWGRLTEGEAWKGELYNRRKDGSEYVESAVIVPVHQPEGGVSHYLAIKEDITEAKRMRDELERYRHHLEELVSQRTAELAEARARAETANQAKSAFLANMSHEIRTPMNAIIGLSHLMQGGSLPVEQAERLRKIDVSARNLLDIINDILDLSKVEAGKLVVERVDFDLVKAISDTLGTVQLRATEKSLTLRSEIADNVPRIVSGDPLRLGQILLNLCGNAVKFTESGSVVVRALLKESGAEGSRVRFEVVDTGIGLTQEQIARLFAPFEQADASTTRTYGGTGLGLAICKRMTSALDGAIGVESVPGVGSTFWFELPFGAAQVSKPRVRPAGYEAILSDRAPAAKQRPAADVRLLLVEDDSINQEVAVEILHRQGFAVDVASNGAIALELAGRVSYDLILMDVQMPVMDGFAATRALRARSEGASIPIVAMTANVFVEDRERCRAAGMDDFVAKPVEPARLLACIAHWTGAMVGDANVAKPTQNADSLPEDLRAKLEGVAELNVGEGLKSVQGRWSLYERLLRSFLRDHAGDVGLLRRFIGECKLADARRVAHTLKGLGGTLGAPLVANSAAAIEHALQVGKDEVAPSEQMVQALALAMERLLTGLQSALPAETANVSGPTDVNLEQLLAIRSELESLLAQDDVRAVRLFESNRMVLRAAWGEASDEIGRLIEGFELEQALTAMRSLGHSD